MVDLLENCSRWWIVLLRSIRAYIAILSFRARFTVSRKVTLDSCKTIAVAFGKI